MSSSATGRSIERRIGIVVLAGFSLLTAALVALSASGYRGGVSGEFERRVLILGESLAQVMAAPLEEALNIESSPTDEMVDILIPRAKRLPLESAVRNDDIQYAAVYLGDRLLMSSSRGGEKLKLGARRRAGRSIGEAALWEASVGKEQVLELRRPILSKDGSKTLGEVAVGFTEARLRRDIIAFALRFAILGVVAMALFLFVALGFLRRQVVAPIKRLLPAVQAAGDGDLSAIHIEAAGDDEIGQLVSGFNRMIERLRETVGRIQDSSAKVLEAAQSLNGITSRSREEMTRLSRSIAEMSSASADVARQAEAALDAARKSTQVAAEGRQGIERLTQGMGTIRAAVDEEARSMQALAKSSGQIRDIVGLISNFADQTNLLSLNAGIEAARAGAAGKGFAVVAGEVRKLAKSSAEGAEQIQEITQQILTQTESITTAVARGGREVEKGHEMTQESSRQFQQIISGFDAVVQQVQQVAAASEEIAASTNAANATAGEHSGAMANLAANASTLTEVAARLRDLSTQFKLGG